MKKSNRINLTKGLLYTVLALFLVGTMINCGGGSSGPAQVQAPKALIQDYVSKHGIMVDTSLVDIYVADEQPKVAADIKRTINEKTATGELERLQDATFDFTNLQIAVVGEKEDYINDQPTKLIKISVSGSYIMKQADNATTIPTDETVILGMVNNHWKVTERINPWS
ncbi:MAG: hypothetical protein ABFR35_00810 [Thermodesulfobacteriota bacterium]